MVLLGDSLTRYQFILLALALRTGGEWEQPPCSSVPQASVSARCAGQSLTGLRWPHLERSWDGWEAFFNGTTAMLRDGSGEQAARSGTAVDGQPRATSVCDCYRDDRCCRAAQNKTCSVVCGTSKAGALWESRYFQWKGLHLTYVMIMGRHRVRGDWRGPGVDGSGTDEARRPEFGARVRHAEEGFVPRWKLPFAEYVRTIIPTFRPRPTTIVFNLGFWLSDLLTTPYGGVSPTEWRTLADAFAPLQAAGVRVVYRTTTAGRPGWGSKVVPSQRDAAAAHFEVLDVHNFTTPLLRRAKEYYTKEGIHFERAEVYHEMNARMLRQLFSSINGGPTPLQ